MADSLVSCMAMEEGLNERSEACLAVPVPARGAPSLLARRPPPPGPLADPGQGE